MNARHNYDMPKQSLEDEVKFDGGEKAAAKKAKFESENAAGPARDPQIASPQGDPPRDPRTNIYIYII